METVKAFLSYFYAYPRAMEALATFLTDKRSFFPSLASQPLPLYERKGLVDNHSFTRSALHPTSGATQVVGRTSFKWMGVLYGHTKVQV